MLIKNTLGLCCFLFLFQVVAHAQSSSTLWPVNASFKGVENNNIVFQAADGVIPPSSLQTKLHSLEYLGTLSSPEGHAPYLVISAKTCDQCDFPKNLFLIRADGSDIASFTYPGKIKSHLNGRSLMESRVFFGKCINKHDQVLVVFQKDKVDRRRYLQSSVFVAEVGQENLKEKLMVRRRPSIKSALNKVRKKQCQEIKGFTRKSNRSLPSKEEDKPILPEMALVTKKN